MDNSEEEEIPEGEEAIAASSKEEFERLTKRKINKKALKEEEEEKAEKPNAVSEGGSTEEIDREASAEEIEPTEEKIDEEIQSAEEQLLEEKKEYQQKINEEIKKYKNADIVATAKATYLLYELPFFKLEPYVLAAITLVTIFLVGMATVGMLDPLFTLVAFCLMVLTAWGFWGIKRFFYMPSKKRFPVFKVFGSGLGALVCEKIDESKVWFSKNLAPTVITNYRAMTEMFTGYPLIIAFEGYFENIDLPNMMRGKANLRLAERLKAAQDEAIEQGMRKERLKQQSIKQSILSNPVAWIGIAILLVLLAYIFFIALPQSDALGKVSEMIDAAGGINAIKAAIATAKAGGESGATVVTAGGG